MMNKEILWDIFRCGVDYGLLLAEEERDSEDLADAFQGHIIDQMYSMPAQPAPRRMPHSAEWRNAKKESAAKFLLLVGGLESEGEK